MKMFQACVDEKRKLFWEVRVYETLSEMRHAADRLYPDKKHDDIAIVLVSTKPSIKKTKCLGYILFCKPYLNCVTILHEVVHAVLIYLEYIKSKITKKADDEIFAEMIAQWSVYFLSELGCLDI